MDDLEGVLWHCSYDPLSKLRSIIVILRLGCADVPLYKLMVCVAGVRKIGELVNVLRLFIL